MGKFSFAKEYLLKPRSVGAVLPSSNHLAERMVQSIDFSKARCIVEYGAGTGVFTKKILQLKKPETVLIVFENNEHFYKPLQEEYSNQPNVYITNDSAVDIGAHLQKHGLAQADYVVSGLPFASLPHDVSEGILTQTKKHLHETGCFITFQYTLLKMDFFARFFDEIRTQKEWCNVPPAYVLACK